MDAYVVYYLQFNLRFKIKLSFDKYKIKIYKNKHTTNMLHIT